MKAERTPWCDWLRSAFAAGLAPQQFWRLSLKEWRALVSPGAATPFDRAEFEALMARYPDHRNG